MAYEAFISYRHNERDSAIAESLIRQIESFVIPSKKLRQQVGKKKIGRLFRDKEELPLAGGLGAALETALRESGWFIILCCPELKDSQWCMHELEYFIACHGTKLVLPIVTEGEPHEVLPPQLIGIGENGMPIEPLAVDVRGINKSERLKKLKTEKLRLIAAMINADYEDLNRRFHKRETRKIAAATSAVAAVALIIAGISVYSAAQIEKQRVIAVANEKLAVANERLAVANEQLAVTNEMRLLTEQSVISTGENDRLAGVRYVLEANAIYDGLYPDVPDEYKGNIANAMEYAVYTQSFQLLAPIKNQNRNIFSLCYSPDDQYLLGIISGNFAALIDANTGDILDTVSNSRERLSAVEFSPSGKYFLTLCNWESSVTVWETAAQPQKAAEYIIDKPSAFNIAGANFLSDSELLISAPNGADTNTAELIKWDFISDKAEMLASGKALGHTLLMSPAVLSPDKTTAVAEGDFAPVVTLFETEHGVARTLPAPEEAAYRKFSFSPDNEYLAATTVYGVTVWDIAAGTIVLEQKIQGCADARPVFSPDSSLLAVFGTGDGFSYKFYLIDVKNNKIKYDLPIRDSNTENSAVFSPDGSLLLAYNAAAAIFDTATGRLLSDMNGDDTVSGVFSHDGTRLVTGNISGLCGIYSTTESATAVAVESHSEKLVRHPPPGSIVGSASLQNQHFYDPNVYALPPITCADPSGRFFAVAYPDGFIEVWDSETGPTVSVYGITEHYGAVSDIILTGDLLISSGYDGRLLIFDLNAGRVRYVIPVGERIPRIEIDKSGQNVIVATEFSKYAAVYALNSGRQLYRLEAEPGDEITDIGFSEDGTKAVIIEKSGRAVIGKLFLTPGELLEFARGI